MAHFTRETVELVEEQVMLTALLQIARLNAVLKSLLAVQHQQLYRPPRVLTMDNPVKLVDAAKTQAAIAMITELQKHAARVALA